MKRSSSQSTWQVRTVEGHIRGPFTTEVMLQLIQAKGLEGTEYIRRLPDGEWKPISAQKDFYDSLLEALEERKEIEPFGDEELSETIIVPPPPPPPKVETKPMTVGPTPKPQIHLPEDFVKKTMAGQSIPNISSSDDEKKRNHIPAILATMGLVFLIAFFYWDQFSKNKSPLKIKDVVLLGPREAKPPLTPEEEKSNVQKAVQAFLRFRLEESIKAQSILVATLESNPKNLDARGLLCLVHMDLWSYTDQTPQMEDVVETVAAQTKNFDPIGINGIYCDAVKLITSGAHREALGLVESALNQRNFTSAPVLYQLKGDLLFDSKDYKTAVLYYEKARQLWPDWVKPLFQKAMSFIKLENPAAAMIELQRIVAIDPQHRAAYLVMGTIAFENFQQTEEASKWLTPNIKREGRVPDEILAQANAALAAMAFERRDLAQAKVYAQAANQLMPSNQRIRDLLIKVGGEAKAIDSTQSQLVTVGDQYFRQGNWLAAQAEYKTSFERDSKNGVAAMKAGRALWKMNQSLEAINWAKKAITADPNLVSARTDLADYLSQRYDYAAAIATLNEAAKKFPNNYEVLKWFGSVELRRNNPTAAVAFFERANKIYQNDADVQVHLSEAWLKLGDFAKSQQHAVKAIELDPNQAAAHVVYARVLAKFKGIETGTLYLRDLIKKFAYTFEYRVELGQLLLDHSKFKEAKEEFTEVIRRDPKIKRAHLGMGQANLGLGRIEEALQAFMQASLLDPSDMESLFFVAQAYIESGRYADAVTQLKRAEAINPKFPLLYLALAKAYFYNNQVKEALTAVQTEKANNPSLAEPVIFAGEIHLKSRNYNKCVEEFQQASKMRPKSSEIYIKLAECYRGQNQLDVAESMLSIASGLESGRPEISRELGLIAEIRGDRNQATSMFQRYLSLSPNARDRAEIESRIKRLGGR